jgi:hypothetical protein
MVQSLESICESLPPKPGQILDLFLDDSIADSVSFGEIKRRAFSIFERDKIRRAADFIGTHFVDVTSSLSVARVSPQYLISAPKHDAKNPRIGERDGTSSKQEMN